MEAGWEESEFPILCETCLGENPYVRMQKQQYGKECKICARPFTVFSWIPGKGMRMKKTEICQTCSKIKNVCQTCVLDLEFGLPVQVRDSVLNVEDSSLPTADINRGFFISQVEGKLGNDSLVDYSRADLAAKAALQNLSRPTPNYNRNRAHICAYYVRGKCNRGAECPYRHELPKNDGEMNKQNIKDRYYGKNDPVAKRMLANSSSSSGGSSKTNNNNNNNNNNNTLTPPADTSITSLYLTGVPNDVTDKDLREYFTTYGKIKSIVVLTKSTAAFVNFVERGDAEKAVADVTYGVIPVKGHSIKVQWGKSRSSTTSTSTATALATTSSSITSTKEQQEQQIAAFVQSIDSIPLPPPPGMGAQPRYASMNPKALGSVPLKNVKE